MMFVSGNEANQYKTGYLSTGIEQYWCDGVCDYVWCISKMQAAKILEHLQTINEQRWF